MNADKTVIMVCQPCHSVGGYSAEAYKIWMTGLGMVYLSLQHRHVWCLEYNVELEEGPLNSHWKQMHDVSGARTNDPPPPPPPHTHTSHRRGAYIPGLVTTYDNCNSLLRVGVTGEGG